MQNKYLRALMFLKRLMMKIQSILPTLKKNKLLIAPLAVATLALTPMNIARAQEKEIARLNNDTIELVSNAKSDEFMYSNLSTSKVKSKNGIPLANVDTVNNQEKDELKSFFKAFILEILAAAGMVGIALLYAWNPDDKTKS